MEDVFDKPLFNETLFYMYTKEIIIICFETVMKNEFIRCV